MLRLVCHVKPPLLKNYEDLTMKLGMKEICAHGTRMQKNPQTREDIFQIFMELCESKILSMASLTPKLSIECSQCWKVILSNF